MKAKIILLFSFISFSCFAQEMEPIQTDRPDQTESPSLTPKGMFQVETGFSFQKNDNISKSNLLPSTLWKYGVNENFELRLITEFAVEKNNIEKTTGLNPILIGCKIKIAEEKGFFPKTSFIGHISLPNAASTPFKTDYFAPEFRFVMQHTLSKKFSFSYNLGAEWDGFTPEPTFIYTVATGYSITEKLGSYIELFGFAPQNNEANHNFDGGLTYLISNNFMVDLSAGIGITKNAPDNYIAAGFSFRI
ncbi:transporter [Flavobacterium capsici]|uniref:Transporter n=1 Tax=Flavobacterium capsici TaxID=3075618 RepID=A0AA96EX11_9FLAO|nr:MULTISPECIES: transporter [unclassified Flavobacterium]WNM19746.1 transporter [Flavobacterium sp. PMR2A8]WNM21135.1 transporter [Flavobacterium sp. PMTSA4]